MAVKEICADDFTWFADRIAARVRIMVAAGAPLTEGTVAAAVEAERAYVQALRDDVLAGTKRGKAVVAYATVRLRDLDAAGEPVTGE